MIPENNNIPESKSVLEDKTILVTGGSGSFGTKFTQVALKRHKPRAVRVFSNNEFEQFQMQQKFNDSRLRYFIGDVREKDRLARAMDGVEIVVHAAALKEVPACEYNPFEAVKTNILGSQNVIDAAIDNGVEKVINISTDKAVNPVNLYGATKLCAEKLFVQANSYCSDKKTKLANTRYGNVAGSRGSVIPLFLEQKDKGFFTITDERMTRFWITLEEGVDFVIACLEVMEGGEVFVPKIPSMKIIDLAKAVSADAQIKIIGIRPGEKIHEVLLTAEEVKQTKEFDNYFVVEPEFNFWKDRGRKDGKSLPEEFVYSSGVNTVILGQEQMKEILKTLEIEK